LWKDLFMARSIAALGPALGFVALGLAGCATTGSLPPTEVIRYHLGTPIARGTIAVQPLSGPATPSLEFQNYAAAVQGELARVGYAPAAPGATPDFIATVDFQRANRVGPPRRSPFSIGLGGGGYTGGYRGGGVGLGGGISFPIGRSRPNAVVMSQLSVTIKRRADQSPVWEGHAQGISDARAPGASTTGLAHKLAAALFTGFPGESGRTIEVK
jgi:hypothetical protein